MKSLYFPALPFQFCIIPETTVKVTKDTVTICELQDWFARKGKTVQLKYAEPDEVQLFIEKMPASVKGKSPNYNFSKLCLVLVLK